MHSEIVGIHYFSNVYQLFQVVKFHYVDSHDVVEALCLIAGAINSQQVL